MPKEEPQWRRNIKRLPWVRELRRSPGRCEGERWSRMPLKAAHDPELRKKYRCKLPAWWSYTYLQVHPTYGGQTKHFCVHHLYSLGVYSMSGPDGNGEYNRVKRWFARNGVVQ